MTSMVNWIVYLARSDSTFDQTTAMELLTKHSVPVTESFSTEDLRQIAEVAGVHVTDREWYLADVNGDVWNPAKNVGQLSEILLNLQVNTNVVEIRGTQYLIASVDNRSYGEVSVITRRSSFVAKGSGTQFVNTVLMVALAHYKKVLMR